MTLLSGGTGRWRGLHYVHGYLNLFEAISYRFLRWWESVGYKISGEHLHRSIDLTFIDIIGIVAWIRGIDQMRAANAMMRMMFKNRMGYPFNIHQ
jgi:hypothetical protein